MLPKVLNTVAGNLTHPQSIDISYSVLFVRFSLGDACSTTGVFPKLAQVSFHTSWYYFCLTTSTQSWSALVKVLLKTQLGLSYKL